MIRFENVTKTYNKTVKALDDVSFNVKGGEIVGFIGPNGSGKTTTMKLLTGIIRADKGKIVVGGYNIREDPIKKIVVAELDGTVCGFAVLNHIVRPENPFMFVRDYLDIDEFCVDKAFRRRGAASEMIRFIRDFAKEQGFTRLELNMWEFNEGALAFYEAAGFKTYRRYMEISL